MVQTFLFEIGNSELSAIDWHGMVSTESTSRFGWAYLFVHKLFIIFILLLMVLF